MREEGRYDVWSPARSPVRWPTTPAVLRPVGHPHQNYEPRLLPQAERDCRAVIRSVRSRSDGDDAAMKTP